jgi:hypothetical protein
MCLQCSSGIDILDQNQQSMNLVNTVTSAGTRSFWDTPVCALLLRRDSICIFSAHKSRKKDYETPDGYFDDKYALVARYAVNLFPVGPADIYVRSAEGHLGNFYGAHVVSPLLQS